MEIGATTVGAARVAGVRTFQAVAEAQDGRTSGFDLMRIALAAAVVGFHSIGISYGNDIGLAEWSGPLRPVWFLILPMFFALSGYLVAGSLERTKGLHRFVGLRAIRIVPALAVETLLCALILGPTLTTLSLAVYFSSPEFWRYFLNILGLVHFTLPGVFHDLPVPNTVNISLWTVPYELECYVALVALALVRVTRNRWLLLAFVGLVWLAAPFVFVQDPTTPAGKMLVLCFLCGVTGYRFRDKIPHSPVLFVLSLAAALFLFRGQQFAFWGAPFAAYVTAYLGLLKAPHIPVLMDGDYSYGLYLFAFPLQQLQSQLFPGAREWYWNTAFALVAGLAYAAFSWHLVEKPILGRRKLILDGLDKVVGALGGAFNRLLGRRSPSSV